MEEFICKGIRSNSMKMLSAHVSNLTMCLSRHFPDSDKISWRLYQDIDTLDKAVKAVNILMLSSVIKSAIRMVKGLFTYYVTLK